MPIISELFKEMEFPDELLLLGSGISRGPIEFYSCPSVRFNFKTFDKEEFASCPVFAHVFMRGGEYSEKAFEIRGDKNYPLIETCCRKRKRKVFNPKDNYYRLEYDWYSSEINFGKWFANRRKEAGARFTTGFFATMFLIYGRSNTICVSGFDGHLEKITDKTVNHAVHDLNLEYKYMLEAVEMAREQGKKVYLDQDFK